MGADAMRQLDTTIRVFLKARPFRPFTVELSSGTKIVVDHPEALVCRGGRGVFLDHRGRVSLFDEDAIARVAAGRNGPSAR